VAITAGAGALSLYWVFLVPIFEAADEPAHLDYALTIYNTGGLLNVRDRPTFAYYGLADPLTYYLERGTGFLNVQYRSDVGVQPTYGSAAFYADLDQHAPTVHPGFVPEKNPSVIFYPFGYYALLAAWLTLLAHLNLGLVAMLFGARILSVALLVTTLPLTYAIARELKIKPPLAVALTAVIGFFPLTSFVSSYVQPDNLSLTLVTLCIYLSLRARRAMFNTPWMIGLGLALGALLVTKYHFYLCVVLAVGAMLITEWLFAPQHRRRSRLPWGHALALSLPSVVLGVVQIWILARSRFPYVNAVLGVGTASQISTRSLSQAFSEGPLPAVVFVGQTLWQAFDNYYLGSTSSSYWGWFGWLDAPLIIGSPNTTSLVHAGVVGATIVVTVLMLARMGSVGIRLAAIARRGRWRWALRIAFSNPFLNSYFIFTVFMFMFFVVTSGTFFPQGRNWFPYLLPALSVGTIYAPRVIRRLRDRTRFSTAFIGGLILYCIVAGYYSIQSVQHRYYEQGVRVGNVDLRPIPQIEAGITMDVGTPYGLNWPNVPRGSYIEVTGWAVDDTQLSPAGAVVASVDNNLDFPGVYGIDQPYVATRYQQKAYLKSGFSITFSTNGLSAGPHDLTIEVVTRDGSSYYRFPHAIQFNVVG
jgi:4-amino-4-deoxy-L-arabinose transferase-like glycosyltransferase